MRRQAIMGTYVLHEHLFVCQAGNVTDAERPNPGEGATVIEH